MTRLPTARPTHDREVGFRPPTVRTGTSRRSVIGRRPRKDIDVVTSSIAAGLLMAAGLAHASIAPAHFAEWWGYGMAFAVVAVVQIGLGAAIIAWHDERAPRAAVVVALISIAAWLLSRTVGLPFLAGRTISEAAGILDLLTVAAEAVAIALLVARPRGTFARRNLGVAKGAGLVLIACLAVAFAAGVGHS